MSYSELDNLSTNELLKLTVIELRKLNLLIEVIFDEHISEEDIEHDY